MHLATPRSSAVNSTRQNRRAVRGLTLVEILVTLVITSVGLLGVAALQLGTLRNNFDATIRTQASILTADIVDRMRANRKSAMEGGAYNTALTDPAPSSPTTQAETDLSEWKHSLAVQMPNGQGGVHYDAATKVLTIEVSWTERGSESAPTPQSLTFSSTTEL